MIVGCTPTHVRTWDIPIKAISLVGIYGLKSIRLPREHNEYHGHIVWGTPKCPLTPLYPRNSQPYDQVTIGIPKKNGQRIKISFL